MTIYRFPVQGGVASLSLSGQSMSVCDSESARTTAERITEADFIVAISWMKYWFSFAGTTKKVGRLSESIWGVALNMVSLWNVFL